MLLRSVLLIVGISISLVFSSCNNNTRGKTTLKVEEHLPIISIDTKTEFQEIENFGASDAWSCQFVGNWPQPKKEVMAKWLFSNKVDDKGNPEGIGLSLWRFNLGAGSSFQGDASGIGDNWRRAESFMLPDGSYDFGKQAGQLWFAKMAKHYEVPNLLIFANSPPVNFTKNGKAYATKSITNLSEDNYDEYSEFLTTTIKGLAKLGLNVNYVSPINEPQWDWSDGGQEGTPFLNTELANLVKQIQKQFTTHGITAKIDITEAGQLNYLFEDDNRPKRGSQLYNFFNKESANYIGDLPNIGKSISGHSYFTTSPEGKLVATRNKLQQELAHYPDVKYWMSEYCILGDNAGEIDGNKRDLGITPALYMAKVIHNDLAVANASAWHWWLAISPYNYKDGLIYVDKNEHDGKYEASKMLWALGNYSRFVKPGYKRIQVDTMNFENVEDLLISGYASPDKKQMVLVVVSNAETDIKLNSKNNNTFIVPANTYVTSAGKNLELVKSDNSYVTIPAKAITTLVYNFK